MRSMRQKRIELQNDPEYQRHLRDLPQPNLIQHPTIEQALQVVSENSSLFPSIFEYGRALGQEYARRAPYIELKQYEKYVALINELTEGRWADELDAGFMKGVLEIIKDEMHLESLKVLKDIGKPEAVVQELEEFSYDLDILSILAKANLVFEDNNSGRKIEVHADYQK